MSAGEHGKQGEYPKDWDIRPPEATQTATEATEEHEDTNVQESNERRETKPQDRKEWIKISELEDSEETKQQLYDLGYTEIRITDGELR